MLELQHFYMYEDYYKNRIYMENDKIGSIVDNLIKLLGEKEENYTIKHFKCEEKLTKGKEIDIIQITMVIEIERKN